MATVLWPEIYPTDNKLPGQEGYLPWTFECAAEDCNWMTAHRHKEGAWAEKKRHGDNSCPYEGGLDMPAGRGMLTKFWDELDRVTKYLIENKTAFDEGDTEIAPGYNKARGQATGIAFCIAHLSRPWFVDENHDPSVAKVAQWARKRYLMNKGDMDFEDTPGVGGYNPMPPARRDLEPTKKAASRAPSPKSDPKTGKFVALTDERKDVARRALNKVPDAQLAKLLKISDEQMAHIRANPESSLT